MKKRKGFTLLELIIVVIIIGVLAAIALPQYAAFVERGRVAEAVNALGVFKTGVVAYYAQTGTIPPDPFDLRQYNAPTGRDNGDGTYSTNNWQFQVDWIAGVGMATRFYLGAFRLSGPEAGTGFDLVLDIDINTGASTSYWDCDDCWGPRGAGGYRYTP